MINQETSLGGVYKGVGHLEVSWYWYTKGFDQGIRTAGWTSETTLATELEGAQTGYALTTRTKPEKELPGILGSVFGC